MRSMKKSELLRGKTESFTVLHQFQLHPHPNNPVVQCENTNGQYF
jgi:hypothetical protein